MGSFTNLNTYAAGTVSFTDNRTPGPKLFPPQPTNIQLDPSVSIDGGIAVPWGTEIEDIVRPEDAIVKFIIDVTPIPGATIQWGTLPAGVTVANEYPLFAVYPINTVAVWNAIKDKFKIIVPAGTEGQTIFGAGFLWNEFEYARSVQWLVGKFIPLAYIVARSSVYINPTIIYSPHYDFNMVTTINVKPLRIMKISSTANTMRFTSLIINNRLRNTSWNRTATFTSSNTVNVVRGGAGVWTTRFTEVAALSIARSLNSNINSFFISNVLTRRIRAVDVGSFNSYVSINCDGVSTRIIEMLAIANSNAVMSTIGIRAKGLDAVITSSATMNINASKIAVSGMIVDSKVTVNAAVGRIADNKAAWTSTAVTLTNNTRIRSDTPDTYIGVYSTLLAYEAKVSPMIMEINTAIDGSTSLSDAAYTIYMDQISTPVSVQWGDGTSDTISTASLINYPALQLSHRYSDHGIYTIKIFGGVQKFYTNKTGLQQDEYSFHKYKITKCTTFGTLPLISLEEVFKNANNLTQAPTTYPTTVKSLKKMFAGAVLFNQSISNYMPFNTLGTTNIVTDLSYMFDGATAFNQPINWCTDLVTDTSYMFRNAKAFNQPLTNQSIYWDTLNITNMTHMFDGATAFNQPLSSWAVNKVTNMSYMFKDAIAFNQPLTGWTASTNINDYSYMFAGATSFNSSIGNLTLKGNVSHMFEGATSFNSGIGSSAANATDMSYMFARASSFNQTLNFDTSNVTDIRYMFYKASSFNKPINSWNLAKATSLIGMFQDATSFNSTISLINTTLVTDTSYMFFNCTLFNQPFSIITSAVTNMDNMFGECVVFDQAVSGLDTSQVRTMRFMFSNCKKFSESVNTWNTSNVTDMTGLFYGCTVFNVPMVRSVANNTWNTANVTEMSFMFYNCSTFNQNLSSWCVPLISSKPSAFDTGTTAWTLPKPIWGTCPA